MDYDHRLIAIHAVAIMKDRRVHLNITLIIVIALVVLVLIGLSVLFNRRNQHAAHPPSGSAYKRAADFRGSYYDPQKTDDKRE